MIKNIIRKIITVLLIAFGFSFYLFSQSNGTILNYSEYIGKIESLIPEMKLTASAESNAYNNLIKAKSSGDVKFDLQAGAIGMQNHFNQYSILPESDFHYNGFRVGAGFSGLIPYSGTRWNVEIRHDGYFGDFKSGNISLLPNMPPLNFGTNNFKYYSPSIKIEIAQPILRDFFGKLDKYPIKDAEYQLTVAKLKRMIDDNAVLSSYRKLYYQWIMAKKLIDFYDEMIKESRNFENQAFNRYKNGLIDNDAYQNAVRQTIKYGEAKDEAEILLKRVLRNIQFFIPEENIIPNDNDWNQTLNDSINSEINSVSFLDSVQGQMAYQLKLRAEYGMTIIKNNSMPDLSIVGNVSLSGLDDSGYFNSFASMTNLNYFVGLMFSYPIGGRDAKAKMMDAYASLNAVSADYDRANRDFEVQIGIYFDEFQSYKKMIENKKREINAIASRINTQNEKFKQGRLPIDEIINTRLELSKARGELLNLEYSIIATVMDYNSLVLLK
ncbi:TolC family protein [Brachyspira sp.]|uniref:TolC family protein n=1 Tax=Brachyspira sp. TaxID=1977261 RepID=UPI003D7D8628